MSTQFIIIYLIFVLMYFISYFLNFILERRWALSLTIKQDYRYNKVIIILSITININNKGEIKYVKFKIENWNYSWKYA
jgi:hypothetical protein